MLKFLPLFALSSLCLSFREADKGGPSGGSAPAPAGEEKPGEKKEEPTPAPAPAPAPAPSNPTPASTEATAAKPSVFARAAAMLKDKSELLTQISDRDGLIAQRDSTITTLSAENARLKAENAEFLTGKSQLEAALEASTKRNTTVEAAAADKIAALGFPAAQLPAASSAEAQDSDAPKTIEDFQKAHSEMTQKDPTAASKFYAKYAKKFGL